MSKFHEVLRIFVIDSEKFLVKALKDVKLASAAAKERRSLLHQIHTIRHDYLQLDLGEPLGKPELYLKEDKGGKEPGSDSSQTEALLATNLIRIKDRNKAVKFSGKSGKKWMVVRDGHLLVHDKPTSKAPSTSIPLSGCSADLLEENKSHMVFKVTTTDGQEYYFAALSTTDADLWVKTLNGLKNTHPKITDTAVAELPGQAECEVEQFFYGIVEPKGKKEEETTTLPENIYEAGDDYDTGSNSSARTQPSPARTPDATLRKPPPIPTPEEEEELYETFNENTDVVKSSASSASAAVSQRPPPELPARLPPPLKPADDNPSRKETCQKADQNEEPEEELYEGIPQDDDQEEYGEVDDIYDEAMSPPIAEDDELYDEVASAPGPVPLVQPTVPTTPSAAAPHNFFHKLYYTKTPYTAVTPSELTLGLGDQLYLLDRALAEKAGWTVGRAGTKTGLVPRVNVYPAYHEVDEAKGGTSAGPGADGNKGQQAQTKEQ